MRLRWRRTSSWTVSERGRQSERHARPRCTSFLLLICDARRPCFCSHTGAAEPAGGQDAGAGAGGGAGTQCEERRATVLWPRRAHLSPAIVIMCLDTPAVLACAAGARGGHAQAAELCCGAGGAGTPGTLPVDVWLLRAPRAPLLTHAQAPTSLSLPGPLPRSWAGRRRGWMRWRMRRLRRRRSE